MPQLCVSRAYMGPANHSGPTLCRCSDWLTLRAAGNRRMIIPGETNTNKVQSTAISGGVGYHRRGSARLCHWICRIEFQMFVLMKQEEKLMSPTI